MSALELDYVVSLWRGTATRVTWCGNAFEMLFNETLSAAAKFALDVRKKYMDWWSYRERRAQVGEGGMISNREYATAGHFSEGVILSLGGNKGKSP